MTNLEQVLAPYLNASRAARFRDRQVDVTWHLQYEAYLRQQFKTAAPEFSPEGRLLRLGLARAAGRARPWNVLLRNTLGWHGYD